MNRTVGAIVNQQCGTDMMYVYQVGICGFDDLAKYTSIDAEYAVGLTRESHLARLKATYILEWKFTDKKQLITPQQTIEKFWRHGTEGGKKMPPFNQGISFVLGNSSRPVHQRRITY